MVCLRSTVLLAASALAVAGVLGGCRTTGRPDHSATSAASPQLGQHPQLVVVIDSERRLTVRPRQRTTCLSPVEVVQSVDRRTIRVSLTDDVSSHCSGRRRHAPRPGAAVTFDVPVQIPLRHVERAVVISPLEFYPEYAVHNALRLR